MRVCCLRTCPADLTLSDDTLAYLFIHEMTDLSDQTHRSPKSVLAKSQGHVKNWLWRANKTEILRYSHTSNDPCLSGPSEVYLKWHFFLNRPLCVENYVDCEDICVK